MAMDYYYSDYDDLEEIPDYDFGSVDEIHSFHDALVRCVQPSITQIGLYAMSLIGWCLIARFLWACAECCSPNEEWFQHIFSVTCGFATLFCTIGYNFLIVLFLSLVVYTIWLTLVYNRPGQHVALLLTIITIIAHFVYEALWNNPEAWQQIRGVQMVATMKVVSLAFDTEQEASSSSTSTKKNNDKEKSTQVPELVPFLGYIFCPATCVLGPWTTFKAYKRSLNKPPNEWRWIGQTVVNVFGALIFVAGSNCVAPIICPDASATRQCSFLGAASVRLSQYFICYLSQATAAAGGITYDDDRPKVNNKWTGLTVTRPLEVEWPRSLSSLVRSWNIPMHDWLKKYIFRSVREQCGNRYLLSVISTYFVSSLLHGFHVQIYLVLLSLAGFAYAENILRAKLATVFDACIDANACRKPCSYSYCPRKSLQSWGGFLTLVVNCMFTLLAIFHLAYLGVMMTPEDGQAGEIGISLHEALSKWSNLGYINHWIAAATYLFYCIV